MDRQKIQEEVVSIVSTELEIASENIREYGSLATEYGMQETDLIEIAISLEEVFEITISDDEMKKWTTVKDIVDYVEGKKKDA